MSDGLTVSEISMLNDLQRLQAISHNLANVNTSGYKQQLVKTEGFQNLMDVSMTQGISQSSNQRLPAQLPQVDTVVDGHSGALKFTGKPLDVALVDGVYMVVQSTAGEIYTRQGDLHIDAHGRLVTAAGLPVQGVSGDIRLTSDKPVINQQGQVYVDQQIVAELKLVKLDAASEIKSLGNALYAASGDARDIVDENVLRQGYIEASNVNMTDQMVKMIELTRHFETTQRVVRGYDDMLDRAINDIADFEGF